jgi:RNA-directed DNA polymerase
MPAMANGAKGQTDWNAVEWRQAMKSVRNLRQRIFRASAEGNHRTVRSLQKLMLRSYSNALLAVRRVTQVNTGKNTPGVDKVVIKTPKARGELVDRLMRHEPWMAKPARRVYIPKASGKRRPLGIPVITDRARQAMVLNALEPEWEARFEGISYGFRPGRGCHDAIARIFTTARPSSRKEWAVDADIKGAFDNISHNHILQAIGCFPGRELVRQWLKAGYVEFGKWQSTENGTPQGGVASPLLANIALHGMEEALGIKYRKDCSQIIGGRALVRYADDFVIFCETRGDAETAQETIGTWLGDRGLTLSEEKTRIVHLNEGFDFLGFNVRRYRAPQTSPSGWKLLIKPSKTAVKKQVQRLKAEWLALRGTNAETVVARLNPIIRGWANYHRIGVAKATFGKLDNWMYERCVRWARYRHPTKTGGWLAKRYWGKTRKDREDKWVFGTAEQSLLKFSWTKIQRHVLVAGRASPDDARLGEYWEKRRQARNSELPMKQKRLADRQKGLCPHCQHSLHNGEDLHVHHDIWRSKGGNDDETNLRLTHMPCHQQIHGAKSQA